MLWVDWPGINVDSAIRILPQLVVLDIVFFWCGH